MRRHHEVGGDQPVDFAQGKVVDAGIRDVELNYIRVVRLAVMARFVVGLACHESLHDYKCQDYAHHPERIGHCAAQGGPFGRESELVYGLLCGAERGGCWWLRH